MSEKTNFFRQLLRWKCMRFLSFANIIDRHAHLSRILYYFFIEQISEHCPDLGTPPLQLRRETLINRLVPPQSPFTVQRKRVNNA